MKHLHLIWILLILSGLTIPVVDADPTVIISAYQLTPEVLMPGDHAVLTLTITNAETTATRTTVSGDTTTQKTIGATIKEIRITPAYDGDRQIRATEKYEDVGDLAPGTSLTINFELIADKNITKGLYFLIVTVDVQSYQDFIYPLPVRISNASVDLLATDIPSTISVGGSTEITLTTVNKREATIDSLAITPHESDTITISPQSTFIGSLAADESYDLSFSLNPHEIGNTNLSFTAEYKNGENTHTKTLSFPLEIVETLDVAPVFTSVPRSIEQGKSSRITLEVYNAKTESISGVLVTPITNATISPSQYFIGSMDPDDVFSASFDITADSLDYADHILGFKVSFKQGNNFYETPSITTTFSVVPPSETSGENNLLLPIGLFLVVLIVIVLYFFLRKR